MYVYFSALPLRSTLTLFADDPEVYDGAPVGVQLVARKFEEEKILAIAKIVVAVLEEAKNNEKR